MLKSDGADVALRIEVDHGVFIEVSCLRGWRVLELDKKSVSVFEVANSHGTNRRSKKALCTVSPSARRTTRRYRFSASGICGDKHFEAAVFCGVEQFAIVQL